MVNTETLDDIFVIVINMNEILLPEDFKIIYDLLWCRRLEDNECNLHKLLIILATRTRLRKTFNESENDLDDTILIYYRFDNNNPLPHFTSKLILVYNARKDKSKYKRLNRDKFFSILWVGKIAKLSLAEQNYVLGLLRRLVTSAKEVELLC